METKQKQLNKHKLIATTLFVVMAIVYFIMLLISKNYNSDWIGYVKAFSEAGMVGALADWFAVTALFKYPMGLKIPHTNLITNKKNALGENLGIFVSENFLNQETIRPYVTKIDVSAFVIKWISQEKNEAKLFNEIRSVSKNIIMGLSDETISLVISNKGKELINDQNLPNLISKALFHLIENNEHQRLISLLIPEAKNYVENNKEAIYEKVVEKNPILGLIGGRTVTNQLISGIISFLEDIENDGNHIFRNELSVKLYSISEAVKTDINIIDKIESFKSNFITDEKIEEFALKLWISTKSSIIENLDDSNSKLNLFLENYIKEVISKFKENEILQNKINKSIHKFIYKLALRNSNEIGTIISNTVKNWDGKEMSNKLELEVGKDLQYIRINGTLVGGIVGLVIYFLSEIML